MLRKIAVITSVIILISAGALTANLLADSSSESSNKGMALSPELSVPEQSSSDSTGANDRSSPYKRR
ncbi:hypothetical protein [Paenibacillus dakarensis]|uniref:hypothetical protein n=1 Tax=Paenibacillus dakarensis TaxID=1527293 RepID=UPI000A648DD7|nr:hypothetical protein [Paenibacillus dakarensis]